MPNREKLSRIVNFRTTPDDHARWKRAAKESRCKNLGDWIRAQISVDGVKPLLTWQPTPKRIPKNRPYILADPALVQQIQRIGNNLNQLAYNANTHKSANDTKEILERLDEIQEALNFLRDNYAH